MLNGSYKILYIKVGTDWLPIGCLTNNAFSEEVAILSSSTRDNSNGWGSGVPTTQSYSISFSGILTLDNRGGTVITYAQIKALKRARTKIEWKIYSSEGGDTDEGFGYFTSIGEANEIDEAIAFDGEILGTGDPSITTWEPPAVTDLTIMIPAYNTGKN